MSSLLLLGFGPISHQDTTVNQIFLQTEEADMKTCFIYSFNHYAGFLYQVLGFLLNQLHQNGLR